jgi:ParB family chromosome partitioning protein
LNQVNIPVEEESRALANISRIKQDLEQTRSLTEVLEIHSQAVAVEAYATARGADEAAQMAVEIKLRCERKAGKFIADMKAQDLLSKGGSTTHVNSTGNNLLPVLPTLKELGVEKIESQRWQRIASIPEEEFEKKITTAKKKTQSMLLNTTHVGQATGENEWYTPEEYIMAAKELMKNIDVDPASSDIANQTVIATKYYTAEDDGRIQKWEGNVWMNPPYAQPLVTEFCDLLVEKFKSGEVKQACVLVNNATETNFYQNMMENCQAICFIKGRVKFIDREGKSTGTPLQGQTILYFGGNHKEFGAIFSQFGVVLHAGK